MACRAEEWQQAVKTRPKEFSQLGVRCAVTDAGTLLVTVTDRLDGQMMHGNLDRWQTRNLIAWLRENFE